jgi:two-component system NarL family response regulator
LSDPIRILIIDDNLILRDGLKRVIEKQSECKVVATLSAAENVKSEIESHAIDIVLLDLGLRSHNSLAAVKRFKKQAPKVKVIVMGLFPTHSELLDFVKAGVDGFLLKEVTVQDMYSTIHSVMNGDKILPAFLTDSLFTQIVEQSVAEVRDPKKLAGALRMTRREKEVIALIADGLTNKEIGKRMHISDFTVKSHVHNILEKLTLHSRVQIATFSQGGMVD